MTFVMNQRASLTRDPLPSTNILLNDLDVLQPPGHRTPPTPSVMERDLDVLRRRQDVELGRPPRIGSDPRDLPADAVENEHAWSKILLPKLPSLCTHVYSSSRRRLQRHATPAADAVFLTPDHGPIFRRTSRRLDVLHLPVDDVPPTTVTLEEDGDPVRIPVQVRIDDDSDPGNLAVPDRHAGSKIDARTSWLVVPHLPLLEFD